MSRYFFKATLLLILFFNCAIGFSIDTSVLEQQADRTIQQMYTHLNSLHRSLLDRVLWTSHYFLDKPYELTALGEGSEGRYDQFPLYRTDAFDCDTFVNTTLAIALAHNLAEFQQCVRVLRYQKGKVSYINRRHFTALDWNKEHQQWGLLEDVTLNIKDQQQHPVAIISKTLINKPAWYVHQSLSTIRLIHNNTQEQNKRLKELQNKGSNLSAQFSIVPYIPFSALFPHNHPNEYLFKQIPQGAIIEIVRPNWDLRKEIGTQLDISHLGFAVWKNNQLYFRQASSQYHKVIDVPLIAYLQQAATSPTIKGINIQSIRKPKNTCGQLM